MLTILRKLNPARTTSGAVAPACCLAQPGVMPACLPAARPAGVGSLQLPVRLEAAAGLLHWQLLAVAAVLLQQESLPAAGAAQQNWALVLAVAAAPLLVLAVAAAPSLVLAVAAAPSLVLAVAAAPPLVLAVAAAPPQQAPLPAAAAAECWEQLVKVAAAWADAAVAWEHAWPAAAVAPAAPWLPALPAAC
jgi:hypothetical protein